MAKKWKILIGVVVVLVIVGCVGLPIAGAVLFRSPVREQGWGHGMMPRWESEEVHHRLEVELVDDDRDGVPDRGVIEFPEALGHGRFAHGRFDHFGPGRGAAFGGHAFGPFLVVRGLVHLVFFAVAVVLAVAFYCQWRKAHQVVSTLQQDG